MRDHRAMLRAAVGLCAGGQARAAAQGTSAAGAIPASRWRDESPQPGCVYGGESAAPDGVQVATINRQIGVSMFQIAPPLAVVQDKSAPGGEYMALPTGTGSTPARNGQAVVAVNIPQDGYYVVWAATQSGDTTTGTDSFLVGFHQPPSGGGSQDEHRPGARGHDRPGEEHRGPDLAPRGQDGCLVRAVRSRRRGRCAGPEPQRAKLLPPPRRGHGEAMRPLGLGTGAPPGHGTPLDV